MADFDSLRLRLKVNGAHVPEEMLPILSTMAEPIWNAMDALADIDFGAADPFDPTRWLMADARGTFGRHS